MALLLYADMVEKQLATGYNDPNGGYPLYYTQGDIQDHKDELIHKLIKTLADVNCVLRKEAYYRSKLIKCMRLIKEREKLKIRKRQLEETLSEVNQGLNRNGIKMSHIAHYPLI